jgi:hypothetical protein
LQIARKIAVSLLVCVLLFAGVCVFMFTSLFNAVEARFYDRTILNGLKGDLASYTDIIGSYLDELQSRFSNILNESAVRNSFWINRSRVDIYERDRIFASLGVSLPALQRARFIDSAGNRILYSTNPSDRIFTDTGEAAYKNYREVSGYIPFDRQLLSGENARRIAFDEENESVIFYYPFYDSADIRRGEALFTVSARALGERLAGSARVNLTDDISVISNPDGVLLGISQYEAALLKDAIASIWATDGGAPARIRAPQADALAILSAKTKQGIFVGLVVPEELFLFPDSLKALLAVSIFITLFVIFFLIINAKQDPVAIVQSRLKELQVSLMHEYYQLMGDMDWAVWRRELEQRRDDVKNELCRGIKMKKGGDIEGYINSFFNRSWDGLLAAIGSRTGMITTFDEAKLEAILSRVLISAKPSGTDYDYEFHTLAQDDYDIEEFQSADEDALPGADGERHGDLKESAEAGSEVTSAFTDAKAAGIEPQVTPSPDEESPETREPAANETHGKTPPAFEINSLQEDPFEDDFRGDENTASKDKFGIGEPFYGEFIRGAPDPFGKTPPYDANASRDIADINEIAKKIDIEPVHAREFPKEYDFELDVTSPFKTIFSGKDKQNTPERQPSALKEKAPAKTEAAEKNEPVIKKSSNGIDYINAAALKEQDAESDDIDPDMKSLVESVLRKPRKTKPL